MCGIVGVLQYPSKVSRYERMRALRFLFPAMLQSAESRGSDATGVYQVHADGDWTLLKKGQKASAWIPLDASPEDPATFSDLVETWDEHPSELKALVGHCRKATVGTFGGNNLDNHPFAIQVNAKDAILGVHNGTLINHEKIFSNLAEMGSPLKREGKVDSEAIFHLLYHVSNRGTAQWVGADLHYAARRMDGSYAIIMVNSSFPDHVVVMRDDRPLEAAIITPYNFLVLASEKKFIEDAVDNYNLFRRFCDSSMSAIQIECRAIAERDYRIFDLTREIPAGKPEWKTFDLISDHGALNIAARAMPETGWTNFKSTTTTSPAYTGGKGTQHGPHHAAAPPYQASVSKTIPAPAPPSSVIALPPSASTAATSGNAAGKANDATVVTEIEVPDTEICSAEEAALAVIEARYLNLCPVFDSEAELATAIGATPISMGNMSKATVANMVSETAFSQGYALGLLDSHKAVEDIQMKARSLSKRMALIAEKKKGAQEIIWEMRQLLAAVEVLTRVGYEGSNENLFLVLTQAMRLPKERVEDILKMHSKMTKDASVKKAEEYVLGHLMPSVESSGTMSLDDDQE